MNTLSAILVSLGVTVHRATRHSERSEESRPCCKAGKILRFAQNDGSFPARERLPLGNDSPPASSATSKKSLPLSKAPPIAIGGRFSPARTSSTGKNSLNNALASTLRPLSPLPSSLVPRPTSVDRWGRHSCLPWAGRNACPTGLKTCRFRSVEALAPSPSSLAPAL
jgi:hypothetical protein